MDNCIFCDLANEKSIYLLENKLFWSCLDDLPVTNGHALVIPKRHVDSFFDLSEEEIKSAYDLIKEVKDIIDKKYHPDAYNIGLNDGKAAGQTIFHLHIHIIPRYFSDVPDPTGGVRNILKNEK
jgi:diadenosine tetraphosphate (Ap4A) HIT family hydrolase